MGDAHIPDWFSAALAAPAQRHAVLVDACPINFLTWGERTRAPLVLVHGGLAHAHWWSAIAPQLARDYFVIAPDLSGHGDSGRRAPYGLDGWVRDVMAVCGAAGASGEPVLVGHSLGGQVAILAAARHGAQLAGVVIVDAPASTPDQGGAPLRIGPRITYPDLDAGMAQFRLLPAQPCGNDYLVAHIARHSLRPRGERWCWKFDPDIFKRALPAPLLEPLSRIRCPAALVRGQSSSVLSQEQCQAMHALLAAGSPLVEIANAGHHLILDQPLAFMAALRAILTRWEHGRPAAL